MLDLTRERDAHIDRRLRTAPIIWLVTTRGDGRPHLAPVWFLWDGSSVLIFSYPNTQKVRNLRRNPAVMLALDTADDGNDVVMIEGRAAILDDPTVRATLPAFAEKYAALRSSTPEEWADRFSQALRVTPTRLISWSR